MSILYKDLFDFNVQNNQTIKTVSELFLQKFGCRFLAYRKFFLKENKILYIVNDFQWMEQLFINNMWTSESFYRIINNLKEKDYFFNVWPDYPYPKDEIYEKLYEYNIWNGIVLYIKIDEYLETFCFVGDRESSSIKNFFINNINLLDDFTHYFKYNCCNILNKIGSSSFIKSDLAFLEGQFKTKEIDLKTSSGTEILKTKFCLCIKGKEVFITSKEKECLHYLSKSKSYKEISNILNISPRTVEDRINRLKIKFDCSCTSKIIDIFATQIERTYEQAR